MPQSFKAFHLGENLLGSGWQKQTITTTAKIDERATTQIDERGALYVFLHYQRANRRAVLSMASWGAVAPAPFHLQTSAAIAGSSTIGSAQKN